MTHKKLLFLLMLSACTDARWARISGEATRVYLSRASLGTFAAADCATKALGDWAYEVRCGDKVTQVRCGYHQGTSCCWPVENAEAATALFGQSLELRRDLVCEGTFTDP